MNDETMAVPYRVEELTKSCCEHPPSVLARLASRKIALESELEEVNKALKLLEENPAISNTLTALSRTLGRL